MKDLNTIIEKYILGKILPSSYLDYVDYLGKVVFTLQLHNDKITYEKFSELAGITKGVLRHILKGRRKLNEENTLKFATILKLQGRERKYFLTLVGYQNAKTAEERDARLNDLFSIKEQSISKNLDQDTLAYVSHWYNPLIHQLIGMDNCKSDPEWIAKKIYPPIKPSQVQKSLDILIRLGLIRLDHKTKKYISLEKTVTAPEGISGLSFLKTHKKMVELGRESISTVADEYRDINTVTLALSQKSLSILKSEIYQLYVKMLEVEETDLEVSKTLVQLNTQVFPVIKPFVKIKKEK